MPYLFLNLKRFDILPEWGGVNRLAAPDKWGTSIVSSLQNGMSRILAADPAFSEDLTIVVFLPETHIISAMHSLLHPAASAFHLEIGCQSVHDEDVACGGNFGAFTTFRPASAMRQLGCTWTIIGHSEERSYLHRLMVRSGANFEIATDLVSEVLHKKVEAATKVGMRVLFCIGETAEEVSYRSAVLARQIEKGLANIEPSAIALAYEPVWAIGPGKTPPEPTEIAHIAAEIKKIAPYSLVYGGGLKKRNARAIGAIDALDGGLVALTRFDGEIGFYPDEFCEIVEEYHQGLRSVQKAQNSAVL
jgi:triosephosphate isomerase